MLISEETIAQLYSENDELRREILTQQMSVRAKELDVEAEFKRVINAANKADKRLADEYTRDYKKRNQRIPLAMDGKGNPMQTIDNFLLIMRGDDFYKQVKYNLLINAPVIITDDGFKRWNDADEAASKHYIEKKYYLCNKEKHEDAFKMLCAERSYHPIRDIIDAVKWDGTERIATLLHKWLHCEDTEYTRECSRLIFAGGINRLYHPGCKFEDVVVLIGTKQGEGKSTFIEMLAIDSKYYREISEIEGQKGMEAIDGSWINEFGELLAVTKVREKDAVKAFISRTHDVYRKPWGHFVTENPRQCIFIGTTNRENFLTDDKNRRFYPVQCHSSGYDIFDNAEQIRADVIQCWAEARHKLSRNEMPAYANRALLPVIRERQDEAREDDWRIGALEKYLDRQPIGTYVCIRQLKREALAENNEFPRDPPPKESQEINIMMNEFTDWVKVGRQYTANYGRQRCWQRVSMQSTLKSKGNFEDVDELPM